MGEEGLRELCERVIVNIMRMKNEIGRECETNEWEGKSDL